jgi:hypothetical protein
VTQHRRGKIKSQFCFALCAITRRTVENHHFGAGDAIAIRDDGMVFFSTFAHRDRTATEPMLRRIIFDATWVAVLIAYVLHSSLAALHGGFREDELGPMGIY